jgi:aldose 1-epimerase|tara:strand:+ start:488 stop:1585 length:1098 start_codon:yes stop_codon:yes gene_type:complete
MTTDQPHFDQPKPFGKTAQGQETELYCLSLEGRLSVLITTYGGIVTQVWAPDRDGNFADVVLGFNELSEYEANSPYFGAIIGRVANRIAKGQFKLRGKSYELAKNQAHADQPCHLHGGDQGFDKAVWSVDTYRNDESPLLKLSYRSVDGEEGYPGNLQIIVSYSLTPEGTLAIEYEATTDATTIVNLTNHSYFNLKGEGQGTILDHQLEIKSDSFTPVAENLIPTGEIRSVENTPFDFREAKTIGQDIDHNDEQIQFADGFDHNYVLRGSLSWLRNVALVTEPDSGRILEVYTTKPGMQFYTANSLQGAPGKSGKPYVKQGAFCLETQGFPDAPNQKDFPSIELLPDEIYRSQTPYRFSTDRPQE